MKSIIKLAYLVSCVVITMIGYSCYDAIEELKTLSENNRTLHIKAQALERENSGLKDTLKTQSRVLREYQKKLVEFGGELQQQYE